MKSVWENEPIYPAFAQHPTPSWGLDRIDEIDRLIDSTYNYGYTGTGVTVYVVDSGITPHPDEFQGRVVRQYNFATVDDVRNPNDFVDECNHGTAVASIIGGTQYGVAKNVSLVSVRIWGTGCQGTAQDFLDAMDRVVADHAQNPGLAVANFSGIFLSIFEPADTAVMNTIASGLTVVLGAGNNSADACNYTPARLGNPASWPNNPNSLSAITVSGMNYDDSFNELLNRGSCVDILAPSREITAMGATGPRVLSGASVAAPHVTGVAAMQLERLASVSPSPDMIQSVILGNATPNRISNVPPATPNLLLFSGNIRRRGCCAW